MAKTDRIREAASSDEGKIAIGAKPLGRGRHAGKRYTLGLLREAFGMRQTDVAERAEIAQSHVSKIESGGDVMLSTLRKYVEALGGSLELSVTKDGRTYRL